MSSHISSEDLLKQIDIHDLSKCKLSEKYIEAFNKDYSLKSSMYAGGGKQVKNTLPRPVKQCRYNPNIP
tara:strand:- start:641 stop:847 length:207 start_codon:yes stop_codon:yes gene_type:complete